MAKNDLRWCIAFDSMLSIKDFMIFLVINCLVCVCLIIKGDEEILVMVMDGRMTHIFISEGSQII